jgi:Sugar-transfer associated ATP-grasp
MRVTRARSMVSSRNWNRARDLLATYGDFYRQSPQRKPVHRQVDEVARLWRAYRFPPYQYLKHGLFERDVRGDVAAFMPIEWFHRFRDERNTPDAARAVIDKAEFGRRMEAAGLPVVRELFVVARDRTIVDAARRPVSFDSMVETLLERPVTTHFVKPMASGQGRGAFRVLEREQKLLVDDDVITEAWFFERLFGDRPHKNYVVQPNICQHPLLERLNPASVNTVRIDTFIDGDRVQISTALLRTSDGTCCTDNLSTGGFIVEIDVATGALGAEARTKPGLSRRYVSAHPVTGFVFDGVVLPHWDALLDCVRRGAEALPSLGSIGWDVAITADGPLFIEANHTYDFSTQQEGARGLRDTPLGCAVRERYGLG